MTSAAPSEVPPLLPEAARSRGRWWIHLLLLGSYPLVIGALGAGRAPADHPALTHSTKGLLFVCGSELLLFGTVFGLAWLASRASRDDLLLRWRAGLWTVPLGLGYSVAIRLGVLIVAAVVAAVLILARLATPQSLQEYFQANRPDVQAVVDVSALQDNPAYFWLTLTVVSFVVAGLREELWRSGVLAGMRVLWPRTLGSTFGQVGAVAISSVIFGLGHLVQGPVAAVATALLGFALGLIMVFHRSIWPAVIAHGAFDATSFALLPLAMDLMKKIH